MHLLLLACFVSSIVALQFQKDLSAYNLNTNESATHPTDYWGQWENHTFEASPDNWRIPFYTIFLDRFANGDPRNDNANGTAWEQDPLSNQLRHGGDVRGLTKSLDYIYNLGVRALYIAGSPMINMPWGADGYSPLDHTLLDAHLGNIEEWREFITEVHSRGMYVIMENTMATMGDLIGFENYLNTSTPFAFGEHNALWKTSRRYHDFTFDNEINPDCQYPAFYNDYGQKEGTNVSAQFRSYCRKSEFDQYGEIAAFGNYTEWQRQLSKFAFVQDRLREWDPNVLAKLKRLSCITIAMLDIDGFRIDKALQVTVDAQADWSEYIRGCAAKLGKNNFYIPGEIVSGNSFGAVYIGRGKGANQSFATIEEAWSSSSTTNGSTFLRDFGKNALDGTAFHYSFYRSLTRFLGIDGVYGAEGDPPVDWVDGWNEILMSNDMVNANTGKFDPRHMYGVSNQDVFRWPGLVNGTYKQILGHFIVNLLLPGVPMLSWGEEQDFYALDSTATNYLFGRVPMTSAQAWQLHGCYKLGSEKYFNFPLDKALYGCLDDSLSLDHRDPSHVVYNINKAMLELRRNYPVLNDGYYLRHLSNQTRYIYLPGSDGEPTELGIWSTLRSRVSAIQDLGATGQGNQSVWLVYGNEEVEKSYIFDCKSTSSSLVSPFDSGVTVKNLFYPYDIYKLEDSPIRLGLDGSTLPNGCISNLTMLPWGFKAFVPADKFVAGVPVVTKFVPGHDARITSKVGPQLQENIEIQLHFSVPMDCDKIADAITIESTTQDGTTATLNRNAIKCTTAANGDPILYSGQVATAWFMKTNLTNVSNGIHTIVLKNPPTADGKSSTNATDRFMFRVGQTGNPMVFPRQANYSESLLYKYSNNESLFVSHNAAGADLWRYSLDWGSTYSDWAVYTGGNSPVTAPNWTGTKQQRWSGKHIIVQYWSEAAGSSSHIQHADLDWTAAVPRRFPNVFLEGPFNEYGYDAGLKNQMSLSKDGLWKFNLMAQWPTKIAFNVWGINPDGNPDQTATFGDVNNDTVLDRIPPITLLDNVVNLTAPPMPYLAWQVILHDAEHRYSLIPIGSSHLQTVLFACLAGVPIICGIIAIWIFMKFFYKIRFNELGELEAKDWIADLLPVSLQFRNKKPKDAAPLGEIQVIASDIRHSALSMAAGQWSRRTVLIATIEYEIEDWNIKIKIGGLGVMASLMGRALEHLNLIWVVPCVEDIQYPVDTPGEEIIIHVMDKPYSVQVQYHRFSNITFVLLDAPIFRNRTKADPYPPRMDDLESAIYYSAWNQCIAEAINRFPVDLYHINDYHGALAPLYLLPKTIPVCLSLHNAEFQGMWPMRNYEEIKEVNRVFNLDPSISAKYVQFGEAFNLLHAGASYLRIHQKGFGAVGVSKKYGRRSFVRYPVFWGLDNIGSLPNPDPADTADWTGELPIADDILIDGEAEADREEERLKLQEWAHLGLDPTAELFVFVGRWSVQKGIDLIADVFPSILEKNPKVQLLTIGPVIDLWGKFAALKLEKMMALYPNRVRSIPVYTTLPPYVFSGAEFALIPSRDEPFGLVAVEFGRKGALGVGSKVGGLGQMPGWWFSVESVTPSHLIGQFKSAIQEALNSKVYTRAKMRAYSSVQRYPVQKWIESLDLLQITATRIHYKQAIRSSKRSSLPPRSHSSSRLVSMQADVSTASSSRAPSGTSTPVPPSGDDSESTFDIEASSRSLYSLQRYSIPTKKVAKAPPNIERIQASLQQPPTVIPKNPIVHTEVLNKGISVDRVTGDRSDYMLQQVNPFFTDSNGDFLKAFEKKLGDLNGRTSESQLCISETLMKNERKWFRMFHEAKLGASVASRPVSPAPSSMRYRTVRTPSGMSYNEFIAPEPSDVNEKEQEFMLGDAYTPPTGLRLFMMKRIGDWPLYSLFLAVGQIIAANSYQIVLLTGQIGQSANKLYILASIYLMASVAWWLIYRSIKLVYTLSIPFIFYGAAFFMIGIGYIVPDLFARGWVFNLASALYTIGSASGSIFFAMNFGDESGAPVHSWLYRACIIQGSQQVYVTALWYWGSKMTGSHSEPSAKVVMGVVFPVACLLWALGLVIYFGLPNYYRGLPGKIPSFYASILRRKSILWFFVYAAVQNFFLSAPYGRNWRYLWSSNVVPIWQMVLLVGFFFVIVWSAMLWIFGKLSTRHSWILPVFAIGLGAPRWCQMLWGVSNIGLYLPWTGSAVASTLIGRGLWLWLGVLDAIQGVGIGLILLQTLTRFHIAFTLIAAQVVGSLATIVARAAAPDKTGPGDVFPDFSTGVEHALTRAWFWIGLFCQLALCVGFFLFFRKEQLTKP